MSFAGVIKAISDGVLGAGAFAGFSGIWKSILDHGSIHLKNELTRVMEDRRVKLLADMMSMPEAETRNLWRRHEKTIEECGDRRFIALLSKIEADEQISPETRRVMLKGLNDMSDARFEQALCLLEHDVAKQILQQLLRRGKKFVSRDIELLRELLSRLGVDAENVEESADEILTPIIGRAADWLEGIQARRRR